jgi:nucleoside-diphosphate-sugar epimerase
VDNLVHAILLGLNAPAEVARGEVFTLSDGDAMSWEEYYGYFATELGLHVGTRPPDASGNSGRRKAGALRSFWNGGLSIAKSSELRGLGRRVLETDPIGTLPRGLLERSPGLDRRLRKLVGADAATVYRPAAESESSDVYEVLPRQTRISVEKARRVLGYEPVVAKDVALKTTLDWLRVAGLA